MMVTSRFALPIALAFSLSACATNIVAEKASRFDQGVAAYDVGDFAAAYRIWSELAREDDLAAMRNTAQLLRQGKGVDKDPKKAFDLYLEAAEKGLVTAMANVGDMYLVLNATAPIRTLTQHFDNLIRAAEVHAHEAAAFARKLAVDM